MPDSRQPLCVLIYQIHQEPGLLRRLAGRRVEFFHRWRLLAATKPNGRCGVSARRIET
jgi:hypothetical protein